MAILLTAAGHAGALAAEPVWTLEAAVQRALEQAPERRAAEAEVDARSGALRQAGAWPNPSVQLRADQKLGMEDGRGGTDLTQIALEQPLPIARLAPQQRAAAAALTAARDTRAFQQLLLETEAARAYHALQHASARLTLARERVAFVTGIDGADRIVRYQSPLDRERLALLREAAHQELANAEGKWSEAAFVLRARLALAPTAAIEVAALNELPVAPALPPVPESHPALAAAQAERDAARAQTDVARARRWGEPALGVFREQDFLAGERRAYNGVMLSVQIPLWDRNAGDIARASAEAERLGWQAEARRRDLVRREAQSRLHLGHLIEQVAQLRARLLQPAERTLTLARRSFHAGETGVLALIDAYHTYFEAHARHLDLVYETWLEAAELRLASGASLLTEARP